MPYRTMLDCIKAIYPDVVKLGDEANDTSKVRWEQ